MFLLRREMQAGEKRLARMTRGARLAKLRVQDSVTQSIRSLADMRGKSRVVVVAGRSTHVDEALKSASMVSNSLMRYNLSVVPVVIDSNEGDALSMPSASWLLEPHITTEWKEWYEGEAEAMRNKLGDTVDDLMVLVIRLDGKVGARSTGTPIFEKLVAEVSALPSQDQYGRP